MSRPTRRLVIVVRADPVICGHAGEARNLAEVALTRGFDDVRIVFLADVSDEEKPLLMAGGAAFALPSKPRPEFVETFGIALVEAMLVGDTAIEVAAGDPAGLAAALDHAVLGLPPEGRRAMALRARAYAMRFDRVQVFDRLIDGLAVTAG